MFMNRNYKLLRLNRKDLKRQSKVVFIKDLKSCYQYLQQLTVVSVVSITPILLRAEYNNCVTRISMRTDGKGRKENGNLCS